MAANPVQFIIGTLLIAGVTFGLRIVFILLAGRGELPPRLLRALSFVPAAVFCALIVSTLRIERVLVPGDPVPQRLAAMAIAGSVAIRTRSILYTIVSGMCALWLINWLVAKF